MSPARSSLPAISAESESLLGGVASPSAGALSRVVGCCLWAVITFSASLPACQVPVFRYALENWQPDPFEVVVLYRDALGEDQQRLVDLLRQSASPENASPANLKVALLDAAKADQAESSGGQVIDQLGDGDLPQLRVYFPALRQAGMEPIWSGLLSDENVARIIQSPARSEIARRLLDGQSAVWVLIESGDAAKDDQAEATLRQQLAEQQDKIHLPSPEELAMEEKFNEQVDVPLRVEFSIIRVSRDDPREQVFREMLLASESDLKDFQEPIAIPIFGRGRSYFALVGLGINAETIQENCTFICGPCSCEAKRLNPGRDMLLAANWDQIIPRDWSFSSPLPELTGVGAFEAALTAKDQDPQAESVDQAAENQPSAAESQPSAAENALHSAPRGSLANTTSPGPARVGIADLPSAVTPVTADREGSLERSLLITLGSLFGLGLCIVVGVTLWLRAGHISPLR